MQRCSLFIASSRKVGAAADEQPRDTAVAPEGGHVQWSAETVATGINSCTAGNKQTGYLHVVVACSKVKGSAPASVTGINTSAAADGQLQNRRIAPHSCPVKQTPLASAFSSI